MEDKSFEDLLTIIEQCECTITEASNKLAEAIRELKRRNQSGSAANNAD